MLYETRRLTDGWRFALDPAGDPSAAEYPDEAWEAVSVPHDWQITRRREKDMTGGGMQGFYPNEGIGWYRLRLCADAAEAGSVARLLFDGVQRFYRIYVNGEQVGQKAYGYVPYACEIRLREGENCIAVRVDNTVQVKDPVYRYYEGTARDRWYSGAGIYRPVELDLRGPVHIRPDGLRAEYRLQGDDAHVTLRVRTDNRRGLTGARLRVTLTAPDGMTTEEADTAVALEPGEGCVTVPFTVPKAQRWDVDAPRLYTVTAALYDGETLLDSRSVRTGFRESVFDGDAGYSLNGRSLKLRGVNLHHDGGAFGAAVPENVLRRRLERLKTIGCNAIRCSHNPKERFFYDLCDEMGFLVIDELYDKWRQSYYGLFFERDWEADMDAWMDRDYNHPCVILWSVGNECPDQYSDAFFADLEMLCAGVRARDTSRPVSYALIGHLGKDFSDPAVYAERMAATLRYAGIVDVWMGNYMEGFYEAHRAAGMKLPVIGSETFEFYRLADLTMYDPIPVQAWNDVEKHPWVCGGFIWAGIDYLGESMGWPGHGWTGCPIDSAGFVKLRGAYTKSLWTDAPMVKIAVYSEDEPYDGANAWWSFPQMVPYWNQPRSHRMTRVAVFTNCEEVTLRQDGGMLRRAKPDSADRMAHFLVSYAPGTLTVEGLIGGKVAATQTLRTSDQAEAPTLRIYEKAARPGDVIHAEVELFDKYGQLWTRERPLCRFAVEGPAELAAVDNGDFDTTTEIFAADHRTLWNGCACAFLRVTGPGTVRVTATVEGYAPKKAEIRVG